MPKVFLNPGHDIGLDPGAVNPDTGVRECDIVMSVGALVAHYLEEAYCEVAVCQQDNLAGEDNYYYDDSVCYKANEEFQADLFVSIHCNSAKNREAVGTECLVYSLNGEAAKAAAYIQNRIVNALGTVDRGIKQSQKHIVLRDTYMPAVLVELAFISNNNELQKLLYEKDAFARAVACGITDYFSNK